MTHKLLKTSNTIKSVVSFGDLNIPDLLGESAKGAIKSERPAQETRNYLQRGDAGLNDGLVGE